MELNIDTGVEEFRVNGRRGAARLTRQTRTSTTAFFCGWGQSLTATTPR